MKSTYKPLAGYIREVKNRNGDDSIKTLLGINIAKFFMPSVANIVGTDLTVYKVVKKGQFACNRMHVGRDKRLPVALSRSDADFIVSPAYDVFEIIDESILNPEYLMMWFSRKEFDRNAWFYTDADVRGGLSWEAFCNFQLPVPSPEKQKEIVEECHTIVNRIKLNEQLNQKLEETAQALYKQWFVDFEFPDENGNPYKSSGGEMEWNAELGKETPKGWELSSIKDFGKVVTGKTPSSDAPDHFGNIMPFVTPGDFHDYHKFVTGAERYLSKKGYAFLKNKILSKGSVIVTCIGSDMGKVVVTVDECVTNQQMNSIIVSKTIYTDYLYYYLSAISIELKSIAVGGSTMPMLSKSDFEIVRALKPEERILQMFHNIIGPVNDNILNNSRLTVALQKIRSLLLAKLATIGAN